MNFMELKYNFFCLLEFVPQSAVGWMGWVGLLVLNVKLMIPQAWAAQLSCIYLSSLDLN